MGDNTLTQETLQKLIPFGFDQNKPPTKYEVKDWLWETHGIWIEVSLWGDGIGFTGVLKRKEGKEPDGSTIILSMQPKRNMHGHNDMKVLEIGILEALEFLEWKNNRK